MLLLPSHEWRLRGVVGAVLACLLAFGVTTAKLGGAHVVKGAVRLLVGGSLAMFLTFCVGRLFRVEV